MPEHIDLFVTISELWCLPETTVSWAQKHQKLKFCISITLLDQNQGGLHFHEWPDLKIYVGKWLSIHPQGKENKTKHRSQFQEEHWRRVGLTKADKIS